MRRLLGPAFLILVASLLAACRDGEAGLTPAGRNRSVIASAPLEIVGHRGAKGITPENTLASFQKALDLGVDMIELDVHLSKDGELVVIHDPNLERTTNGSGLVGDYTLEELRSLDAAARFEGSESHSVQRIPTLQEVYDLVQGKTQINIEIKTAEDGSRYPGIEREVVESVQQNEAISYTIVSSFDFPTLKEIERLEPGLARYAIISTGYFREMGLEGKRASDVVADLMHNGFRQVAVNKEYLSPKLMSLLDQAGFRVVVWIVNDADEMWSFVELGVDRMTTDRPDLLIPAYQASGAETSP